METSEWSPAIFLSSSFCFLKTSTEETDLYVSEIWILTFRKFLSAKDQISMKKKKPNTRGGVEYYVKE